MVTVNIIITLIAVGLLIAWIRERDRGNASQKANADLRGENGALREDNAAHAEAVKRLEDELKSVRQQQPRLDEFTASLGEVKSSVDSIKRNEENRDQLLSSVDSKVDRAGSRIDSLVGRWANPKRRSQLGEAWLIGALKRMGLREDIHFEVQTRVTINGKRGTREGVIDILVRLPNANGLALDSKFPWDEHLPAILDADEATREVALRKLRDALREHIKDIARREYHCAEGVDLRHVLVVVPDWQTLETVKVVDPQITVFAREAGVGLVPADGLYEIAAALGELHREEGWGEKIREIFSPVDADRMYSACADLLERAELVVKRHNSAGDAIDDLAAAFGPNGLMGRDVLGPATRAAEKIELERDKEVRQLDEDKVVRHGERIQVQRAQLADPEQRPEAA